MFWRQGNRATARCTIVGSGHRAETENRVVRVDFVGGKDGVRFALSRARGYHRTMQVVAGTVIEGKVVLEGVSLPEGTAVTVFAQDLGATVRLPSALQVELEEALEEADHEEGISGDELFRKLQKYG